MMQETGREINWLERIFSSEKASVEVVCGDRVINPFTTIELFFYADGEPVKRYETIFKCDTIENCGFCFTHDFSSVVLSRGREKRIIPTVYRGVLLWRGVPVFEEQYFEEIKIYPSFFAGRRGKFLLIRNFRELIVEKEGELSRLITDNRPESGVFTERLTFSQELF